MENAFSLSKSGSYSSKIEGVFSWENETTLDFKPFPDQIDFPLGYTIQITSAAKDLDGNILADNSYTSFTVLNSLLRPKLINSYPIAEATNISVLSSITLAFNQAMDEGSTRNAFSLMPNVDGVVQILSNLLVYSLNAPMTPAQYYTVKVDTTARSVKGSPLGSAVSYIFFTA